MKIIKSILIVSAAALLAGCTNFITRPPQDAFSDENFWKAEANVQLFAGLNYDTFFGYGNGTGTTAAFYFQTATPSLNIDDNLCQNTFISLQTAASSTNANWTAYYTLIRRCNLMLERIATVPMSEDKKAHWTGVAKFFRAFTYYRLSQQFGSVPYFDKYLSANDPTDLVYPMQTPRDQVIAKVIADLQDAASKMLPVDDKNLSVNKYTAYALLSTVNLWEGAYRKYQLKTDGTPFFNAAKAAALEVINSGRYWLGADWKALYNSIDLTGNSEVILAKQYITGVLGHSIQSYTNTSTVQNGLTKWAAESYCTVNGLPIHQDGNGEYKGDATIADVFANRDPRFAKVIKNSTYAYIGATDNGIMSNTGYEFILYNNPARSGTQVTTGGQNDIDCPLFTYSEVLLNYAEACAELGNATNADLDKSLNLTRKRAGIAPLTTDGTNVWANGVQVNDPVRTGAVESATGSVVSPLIWEVRRERRLEFMSNTYLRVADLIRWKKGKYLDFSVNKDVARGAKVTPTKDARLDAEGYLLPYTATSVRTFDETKYYLNSIPTNDINLYKAEGVTISQNPGW